MVGAGAVAPKLHATQDKVSPLNFGLLENFLPTVQRLELQVPHFASL